MDTTAFDQYDKLAYEYYWHQHAENILFFL